MEIIFALLALTFGLLRLRDRRRLDRVIEKARRAVNASLSDSLDFDPEFHLRLNSYQSLSSRRLPQIVQDVSRQAQEQTALSTSASASPTAHLPSPLSWPS